MGKNYTPGHASALFSDWLKPYMQEYERKRENREYKAPLGERNIGILNAVLASANTIKKINDTIETNKLATGEYQVKEGDFFDETSLADLPLSMQPQAIFEKGKTALFGPGVERIPDVMKNGGKIKKYQDIEKTILPAILGNAGPGATLAAGILMNNPKLISSKVKKYQDGGDIDYSELFKKVETPEIKEISKAEAMDIKLSPIAQKGYQAYGDVTGALGSIETLEKSDSGVDKAAAIYDLAEKGERGIRALVGTKAGQAGIKAGTELGKAGVKAVAGSEIGKAIGSSAIGKAGKAGIEGAKKVAGKLMKKKAAEELTKQATKEAGKAVAKEAVEGGAKSTLGKLAPGVGIGLGAHQIATAKNPLGKIGGAFDVAAGVTSFLPGVGTVASGILGGIGTGLSMLGGMSEKPKGRRHIARW